MSDPAQPTNQTEAAKPAEAPVEAPKVEEWKPEPRQWTWKDLFTAPMLAFKPKCMVVMAVTLLAIALWYKIPVGEAFGTSTPAWVETSVGYLWMAVALVIFSLGATLVATFMKADLLDDEFLTLGEALAQWKGRLLSAILVPVFLTGLYGGFQAILAGCELAASIPYVGPTLYGLLYPLAFLFALLIVLLGIAVALAVFVFPAIVAIRKHGWFDNVVDTFEAVGTKPHVLVLSAFITGILIWVSGTIAFSAMGQLQKTADYMPGTAVSQTEQYADHLRNKALGFFADPLSLIPVQRSENPFLESRGYEPAAPTVETWHKVTGSATGVWKILFTVLIGGYLANLFVGGGMLTYLAVREDDYWDDEDLEDLDKLAKELEDEAKAEAAKAAAETPAAEAPKPAEPAAETKVADKPAGDAPAGDKPANPA